MDLEIRLFNSEDRTFLAELFESYLAAERRRSSGLAIPPDFATEYLPKLLSDAETKGGTILVAESSGERAGFVVVLPQERPSPWDESAGKSCIIMELHVKAEFQRQGIGGSLLRDVERRFAELGFDWITLGVFAVNSSARALYSFSGYRETYHFMGKRLGVERTLNPA